MAYGGLSLHTVYDATVKFGVNDHGNDLECITFQHSIGDGLSFKGRQFVGRGQ
jgi:hypothetical protein